MDADTRERAAFARIRVLRRYSYRCQFRTSERAPICGAPASSTGPAPTDAEPVALCLTHGQEPR